MLINGPVVSPGLLTKFSSCEEDILAEVRKGSDQNRWENVNLYSGPGLLKRAGVIDAN
jgi:hypothetical protein